MLLALRYLPEDLPSLMGQFEPVLPERRYEGVHTALDRLIAQAGVPYMDQIGMTLI